MEDALGLKVAVQMDPLESINIAGDSTFAVMLSAQARGHTLWQYGAGDLCYRDGRVTAPARPVTVRRVVGDHHTFGPWQTIDLSDDIDVVLMRQDPPFDLAYITATHLLERIQPATLVVNDPAAWRMPAPSTPNMARSSSSRCTAMPDRRCSMSPARTPTWRR
jgi:glutathione synthase